MEKIYKECSTCGRVLPLDQFHKQASREIGVRADCKDCHKDAGYEVTKQLKEKFCLDDEKFEEIFSKSELCYMAHSVDEKREFSKGKSERIPYTSEDVKEILNQISDQDICAEHYKRVVIERKPARRAAARNRNKNNQQ